MSFKEKFSDAIKSIQKETEIQVEKAKLAIENFKPNQLERNITKYENDIQKYKDLLENIKEDFELKEKEYEYRLSAAEQEKSHTEQKLAAYKKNKD